MRTLLAALLVALAARAADDCSAPHDVDRWQLLRRLSLDLRGRVPSVEEYQALDQAGDVPAGTIEPWLQTDDFRAALRRYHESMFWPNVSKVRLNDTNTQLGTMAGSTQPGLMVTSAGRQRLYRGGSDGGCGDYEQTFFDAAHPGEYRPDPAHVQTTTVNGVTVVQEGWRLVSPYWAPATQIKACAFDAQESPSAALPGGRAVSCAAREGEGAQGCGCGPGLKWCYAPGGRTTLAVLTSLREQLGRAVDDVATGQRPYTDLLLATDAWENGAIAFWKKNLAAHYSLNQTFDAPDPGEELADRDFNDASYAKVQRTPLHAGVVTLPGYLLRFQTDRGRANRFRINFLCSYFVPPAHLETSASGTCSDTAEDITQRCNCRYCHSVLEPMAAHWGLFAMAGTTQMTDPALFPKTNPACKSASPSAFCGRFYVTRPDAHNAGALLPYQFSDAHPEIVQNIEGGPRVLAQEAISQGQFARCTVQKMYLELINQEIAQDDGYGGATSPLLDQLAQEFSQQGYSLPRLVERIATLPEYRRAR